MGIVAVLKRFARAQKAQCVVCFSLIVFALAVASVVQGKVQMLKIEQIDKVILDHFNSNFILFFCIHELSLITVFQSKSAKTLHFAVSRHKKSDEMK